MATINLGRIKPIWQGDWAASTAYAKDDIVKYGINSYICTTAHTSGATFNTADGWDLLSQGAEQGGFTGMQVFDTAGTYTWTKPVGVTKVKVYVTGGGGSGGGGTGSNNVGTGGGAGGTAIKVIDVSSVSSVSVTVGARGNGGQGNNGTGNSAGSSSFGSYCTGGGGEGGGGADMGIYGRGGTATGGDINITGGSGSWGGGQANSDASSGGQGGTSFWGGAGGGYKHNNNYAVAVNLDGQSWGSGGSGGADVGSTVQPSGNGKAGVVVIEEYR